MSYYLQSDPEAPSSLDISLCDYLSLMPPPTVIDQVRSCDLNSIDNQKAHFSQKLVETDTQIRSRKLLIARLEDELNHLNIYLETYRALSALSPIRSLPPEILAYIFTLLCHSLKSTSPRTKSYPVQSTDAMYLSQVCSLWRNILLSTPRLWTTLYIDLTCHNSPIELCLERSRSLPLTVSIINQSEPPPIWSVNEDLFKYLMSSSSRWRHLTLRLNQAPLKSVFRNRIDAPILETLVYKDQYQSAPEAFLTDFFHVPKLHTVRFNQTLETRRLPLEGWLQKCMGLKCLEIGDLFYRSSPYTGGLPNTVFSSTLEELSIDTIFSDTGPSLSLLATLNTPCLTSLHLDNLRLGDHDPWPHEPLVALLQRCSLVSLTLDCNGKDLGFVLRFDAEGTIKGTQLIEIFRLTPKLKYLSLRKATSIMLPALFSCLTIAELQTALLPDLDHLVIGAYEMHESPLLPGLSSMLESRSMSSLGSNVNSLRTFDIEMYSGERDALQKLPSWPDFMSRVELLRKAGMIVHLDLQYPLGRVTSLRVNELEWSDDEY